jgi:cytochrome b pre-mRNA-processing protein 3
MTWTSVLSSSINITRLRALPPTHSKLYQTEFLTHFFSLLEVRMRRTMGPRHPERYIKKHMVIYGEQFRGCQLSFDLALAGDDVELAMYVWRNMFGARGMQRGAAGVKVPTGDTSKRLVSSLAVGKPDGMGGIITEEDLKPKLGGEGRIGPVPKDTKSPPLLDEIPEDWDPLMMVEQISEVVGYIRREVRRLEDIPDEMVQAGFVGAMGPIREVDVPLWREIMQEEAEKVLAEKGEDWMPSRFI